MFSRKPAELVTFYSGQSPEAQPFVVHKEFAIHYSAPLKEAFASDFIEGQTQEYRFEDATDTMLRLLVTWIYTQHVDIQGIEELMTDTRRRKEECRTLCHLWVLAGRLLIPRLQNMAIDKLTEICDMAKACSHPISLFPSHDLHS